MQRRRVCLLFTSFTFLACDLADEPTGPKPDPKDDTVVEVEVGPAGGVVEAGALRLDIPADALAEATDISVRISDAAPAADHLSPTWIFEPAGLEFAQPVYVEIALDSDATGTLMWSVPGTDDVYEPVGLAAAGLAGGYTTHFSNAYVDSGTCPAPGGEPTTRCACRANDEIGDLVCPTDLVDDVSCPDINGFMGSDGGGCSGYARRDEVELHCFCYSETDSYLCPEPLELGPMQSCPHPEGAGGFIGEPGASCSGYTVSYDPETMETMNVGSSGTLVDCSEVVIATEVESVGGTLEGCYATSEALSCPYEDPDTGEPIFGLLPECQTELDALKMKGRTTACALSVGDPGPVGTRAGEQIEALLAEGDALRQVTVPYGSKKYCETTTPIENRGNGKLDLVVVDRSDPNRLVVEIAEVKPLTPTGIPAGDRDVYDCYEQFVKDAASHCDDDPIAAPYDKFCDDIDANGAEVVVAEPIGATFASLTFDFVDAKMKTHAMKVVTCMPGVFAYVCVE
jgi:hypothetical protein